MAEARARREEERAGLRAVIPESVLLRDRVRWAPIWAGIVIALATQLVLTAIAVAIGFISIRVTSVGAIQVVGSTLGIWTAVTAIISLFIGGYVAARLMPVDTRGMGAVHGVAVWALTIVIGSLLVFLVLSAVLIFLGSAAVAAGTGIRISPSALDTAGRILGSGAGWFVLWSLLALGAAVLGGYLGMASNQTIGRGLP